MEKKNPHAVILGRMSAKKTNRKGNSIFGKELANKRWHPEQFEAKSEGSDLSQTSS